MRFGSILKKNQRLRALNEDDPEYQYGRSTLTTLGDSHQCSVFFSVQKLFDDGWKHPNKTKPAVRSIFKLLKTPSEMGEHRSYR